MPDNDKGALVGSKTPCCGKAERAGGTDLGASAGGVDGARKTGTDGLVGTGLLDLESEMERSGERSMEMELVMREE